MVMLLVRHIVVRGRGDRNSLNKMTTSLKSKSVQMIDIVNITYNIRSSQGCVYGDDCFLGYDAV
jgi:hypothetical protein